jgi:hypothetical protein
MRYSCVCSQYVPNLAPIQTRYHNLALRTISGTILNLTGPLISVVRSFAPELSYNMSHVTSTVPFGHAPAPIVVQYRLVKLQLPVPGYSNCPALRCR